MAQLSGAYAHHYDLGGAAVFALAFLAMWWCWLGHTFHATRFDDDRANRRAIGFLQIAATALIGYGASAPLGDRAWAFGGGIAAFKALLALAYLGERRWRGALGLIRVYATLYAVQAVLWLAGAVAGRWPALGLLGSGAGAGPGLALAGGAPHIGGAAASGAPARALRPVHHHPAGRGHGLGGACAGPRSAIARVVRGCGAGGCGAEFRPVVAVLRPASKGRASAASRRRWVAGACVCGPTAMCRCTWASPVWRPAPWPWRRRGL